MAILYGYTTTDESMTDDQKARKAEFDRLFPMMPGRNNAERLKAVCAAAIVKPGTVRQWRMANPPRVPPERTLEMIRRHLGASNPAN